MVTFASPAEPCYSLEVLICEADVYLVKSEYYTTIRDLNIHVYVLQVYFSIRSDGALSC
jgi:hypothetical protein